MPGNEYTQYFSKNQQNQNWHISIRAPDVAIIYYSMFIFKLHWKIFQKNNNFKLPTAMQKNIIYGDDKLLKNGWSENKNLKMC